VTRTEPTPTANRIFGSQWRTLTSGLLAVVSLVAFEAMAVATAMPVAVRQLDGLPYYAWGFSAFFITSLVGMVLAGDLSDRRGPLTPFLIAVTAFGVGLVLAGTATLMPVFVLGRAVQGFGAGLVVVVLYVVVGRTYPEAMRPKVFAAISSAWVLPAVIGPSIAGLVADHLSWRVVFLAVPPLVAPAVLLMVPRLRPLGPVEAEDGQHRPRLVVPALAAAVGVGALQYAGQRLDLWSVPLVVAAAALLVPSLHRLLPPGIFRVRRGLPTAILMRGVLAGAFFGAEAFVPLMLVEQRDVPTALAGVTLTAAAVSWSIGSWLQGRTGVTLRRDQLIRRGAGLVSLGVAGVSLGLWEALPPYVAAAGWAVGGLGMGLALSSTSVVVLNLSPVAEQGFNSAALQVSDALGAIVMVGVGGAVFAAAHGPGSNAGVFLAIYLLMASVALVGFLLAPRVRDTH
jgi:MFS family permease